MAKRTNAGQTLQAALAVLQQNGITVPNAPVNPAATAPLPGWVSDAIKAQPAVVAVAAPPKQPAYLTRKWALEKTGVSQSGNPTLTFLTHTSNGLPFRCTVPTDLAGFIRDMK